MGLLSIIAGAAAVALVGAGVNATIKENARLAEEEQRRKSTPCYFPTGINQADFDLIVMQVTRRIKRLSKVEVDGHLVYGTVESQSGISTWHFKLDFNNYGIVDGRYWLSSDNSDSTLPNSVGDKISVELYNSIYNSAQS